MVSNEDYPYTSFASVCRNDLSKLKKIATLANYAAKYDKVMGISSNTIKSLLV